MIHSYTLGGQRSLWQSNGSANAHQIYDYNHDEIVTVSLASILLESRALA